MKLHLACGTNILENWVNLDLEPLHKSVIRHDLTRPLPFPQNIADVIYSEHFIEHIPKDAAYVFIKECFDKLKPGAIIRLSTPNLERITRQYAYGKTDAWANVGWLPESKCDLVNEGLKLWGHHYVYDWHELEKMLRITGFINIKREKWGASNCAALVNIECRPDNGELIIEATKPLDVKYLTPKPKVSVAIASYNHADYIRVAIDSVLNQSFQDFEIIVTDDGSTDGTADAVEAYSDERIKLKRFASNKGACFATNDAISRSQGEYIAILSSDDAFFPDKLQKQVNFLDVNPQIGAVFSYPEMIDELGEKLPPEEQTKQRAIFEENNKSQIEWLWRLFHSNCLCHPSVLIRKSCYDKVGLYNPSLRSLPDYEMWVRLLQKTNIHIIREPLIKMRKFENEINESGNRPDQVRRMLWEHIKVIKRFLAIPDYLWQPLIGGVIDVSNFPQMTSYKREFEFAALCIKMNTPTHVMAAIQVLSSIDDESDETANAVYRVLNDLTAHVNYGLGAHKNLYSIFMNQQ